MTREKEEEGWPLSWKRVEERWTLPCRQWLSPKPPHSLSEDQNEWLSLRVFLGISLKAYSFILIPLPTPVQVFPSLAGKSGAA